MTILLASYKVAAHLEGYKVYSVAAYQAGGDAYPELKFLAPLDARGKWMHRNPGFTDESLKEYRSNYFRCLASRKDKIMTWLKSLDAHQDVALCCWCNPQSGRGRLWFEQRQVVPCHRALIGQLIRQKRPDIDVQLDDDMKAYSPWRV
jgi:hypothetical protein